MSLTPVAVFVAVNFEGDAAKSFIFISCKIEAPRRKQRGMRSRFGSRTPL